MTYRVLIVEDDPMVLAINQRYLEKVPGFMVAGTAGTYESAVEATGKETFDLILVDIHLKSGNGLDLIKTLRKEDYPGDIIMITAASEQEALRISLQSGVMDYILKPFQFSRFKKSLELFLKRQEILTNTAPATQAQLDEIHFHNEEGSGGESPLLELEKGLTQQTLDLIMAIIKAQTERFTVTDITDKTDLSHVSVRKYLHYLENQGIIKMELEYGTVGRPTSFYALT